MDYESVSKKLKAIADPKRLKIVDLLSCHEMCACDLLEHFDITQPSLSHHMKILEKAGVINVTKKGQWHYYELRAEFVELFEDTMETLFADHEDCSCYQAPKATQCAPEKELSWNKA